VDEQEFENLNELEREQFNQELHKKREQSRAFALEIRVYQDQLVTGLEKVIPSQRKNILF
jgi:hypothetical protein